MARASGKIHDRDTRKRVVYVSWEGDQQGFAAICLKALENELALIDEDAAGREWIAYVSQTAGDAPVDLRKRREEATDFVGLFTSGYLAANKAALKRGQIAELIEFIRAKLANPEERTMWILPLEAVSLSKTGFKAAELDNLDFPWWHGISREDEQIDLPDESPRAKQQFGNEVRRRVYSIRDHDPRACAPCHPPNPRRPPT